MRVLAGEAPPGVEADRAPLAQSGAVAPGAERKRRAHRGSEAEPLPDLSLPLPIGEALQRLHRRADLSGGTDAGLGHRVDREVLLDEEGTARAGGHLCDQRAIGVGECLPGRPFPVRAIADALLDHDLGVFFTFRDQHQGIGFVGRTPWQPGRRHDRLTIACLQPQDDRKKVGLYALAAIIPDVERGELVIAEHLATLNSQEAIKRIATDEVEVEVISLEEAALVRAFSEYYPSPSVRSVGSHQIRSRQPINICRPHF